MLIDFRLAGEEVKDMFRTQLDRLDDFFFNLSAYYNVRLVKGKSLIIFDEIQFFPRARESIKWLVADGRFDYLETGSLVSIDENVKDIAGSRRRSIGAHRHAETILEERLQVRRGLEAAERADGVDRRGCLAQHLLYSL